MTSLQSPPKLAGETRSTKILSEEYWKEFFDEFHRHPKTLDKVFNEWKIYGHSEKVSFWDYLKEVEEKFPELKNENEQVLYLTPTEREKYQVSLEMNQGRIILIGN